MSNLLVAVQLMMFREIIEREGIRATFQKIKDIGINQVEISQIPMTDESISEIVSVCQELDMGVCAISAVIENFTPQYKMDTLKDDFERLVKICDHMKCRYIRIGALPFQYMKHEEKYLMYAEQLNEYGKKLKKYGIKLFYHNHHFEFTKFNRKLALDILVENTDPQYVGFELDTHWIHRGGADPVAWIKKLKGRVELVHLKDYRISIPKELTGFKDLAKMVEFAEIGEGNLDFKAIINACIDSETEFMPIEQDITYGREPFESLKISVDNIKKMGFGNNF